MFTEPVVYLDIETSGSNAQSSKIIEIGAIRVEDGVTVNEFKSLVNPGSDVSYWITNLTGIHNSDLTDAPYFEDIADQLSKILDGAIFIAHNVRFDYSFVKKQLEASGYKYNPKLLCTVRLSRALFPGNKGHSLEKIIERHGIQVSARHRAYDDAKAIKDFAELVYTSQGHDEFQLAVNKQLRSQSLPPNLSEEQVQNMSTSPGVYVFENEQGQPIYIGKSVNLKKRVMSHFTQDTKSNREMKLSQNAHNIGVIETKSELEALLLESKLVKEMLPTYNRQLRRTRSHFVLLKSVNESGYTTITIADRDLAREEDLEDIYGIYPSKAKARSALMAKQKTYDLCPKLLNLEKASGFCFSYQLGKCKGACGGIETPLRYNGRVEIALDRSKVESWPFRSAIAMSVNDDEAIVIDNWIILGYLNTAEGIDENFRSVERNFDVDTYRILRSFIAKYKTKLTIKLIDKHSLTNLI
jgi:DNA polymerase-3 subunit epsilon